MALDQNQQLAIIVKFHNRSILFTLQWQASTNIPSYNLRRITYLPWKWVHRLPIPFVIWTLLFQSSRKKFFINFIPFIT